jgi:hypothetical protein
MVKYVLLVAVAAIGITWFHARHAAAAAEHHLWGNIASELAQRPVRVHCQGFVGAAVDVTPEAGWVPFDASGKPADYTNLKRNVCTALARYSDDSKSAAFACVMQNVPCSSRIFADVQAVHVLAHESAHLSGEISEARAECQGLHTTAYVAMRLGSDRVQAGAVAQYYYRHMYPNLPDEYRAANCAP